MKWIGQHIHSLIARFRSDVYLEDLTTDASTDILVVDSDGKICKNADAGDDTSFTVAATTTGTGTTITDGDSLTIAAGTGITTTGTSDGVVTIASTVTGDITGVTAGTGLSGGGTSGGVTLNVEATQPDIDSIGTIGDTLTIKATTVNVGGNSLAGAPNGVITLKNNVNDAAGPDFHLTNERMALFSGDQPGVDDDVLGTIHFNGHNDGTPALKTYAKIYGEIADASTGGEEGRLIFQVMEYDGTSTTGLKIEGQDQNGEIDVTIGAGVASTTTVVGDLTLTGDVVMMANLPTSDPSNAGQLWSNSGIITLSAG